MRSLVDHDLVDHIWRKETHRTVNISLISSIPMVIIQYPTKNFNKSWENEKQQQEQACMCTRREDLCTQQDLEIFYCFLFFFICR